MTWPEQAQVARKKNVSASDLAEVAPGLACYAAERALPDATDLARGRTRLMNWAELVDDDDDSCELAISALGVDRARLIRLLGGSAVSGLGERLPPWARYAERLCALGADQDCDPAEYGLVTVAADLVHGAQAELSRRVASARSKFGWPPELKDLPEILSSSWPRVELEMAVHRTMVLELNVARVQGRLSGESPKERYDDYLRQLAEPRMRQQIWAEYPVLLRYCVDRLNFWVDSCCEFASHLAADFDALPALLGGAPGPLKEVRFGVGDSHRSGRAVAILEFATGHLVYKPRSLRIERGWHAIIDWFNEQGPRRTLIAAPVVLRDGYGWAAYVAVRPCADEAGVGDFYWRIGALTALLHAVRAIDVHVENVIASGSHPVPVDLETLLHDTDPPLSSEPDPADELLRQGVARIGILPGKLAVRVDGRARSFEYGVVGLGEQQVSLFPVAVTQEAGTDQARVVAQHIAIDGGHKRVSLGEETPDPLRHCDDVIDGFTWTYRTIVASREHWIRSLLPVFAGSRTRFLPRSTSFYDRLLTDSLHPDFLRDALERERSLVRVVDDVSRTPVGLLRSELADLRSGDIPYFEVCPERRDLFNSRGEAISEYLAESPLDAARARMAGLGEADLAIQQKLIRMAFGSLRGVSSVELPAQQLNPDPLGWDEARMTAEELALNLCRDAVRGPTGIGWLAVDHVDESVWQLGAAPPDLYSGRCGIGFFLSTVAAHQPTRQEITETALALAEATARQAVAAGERIQRRDRPGARSRREIEHFADPGAFGEIGGTIYYLAHAGVLHDRGDFLMAAEALVPVLREHVAHDRAYDVIGGSAGAILAVLALHAVRPSPHTLAVAGFAAERLIAATVRSGAGLAWPSADGNVPHSCMAHGTAGICYALGRLHEVAPDPALTDVIAGGLRYEYEQEHFATEARSWPEPGAAAPDRSIAPRPGWCHGASGIGLARLGLLHDPASPEVRRQALADLREAMRNVALWAFGRDGSHFASVGQHGLCHGDLGNLEFLALATRSSDALAGIDSDALDIDRAALCVTRAARVVQQYGRSHGWLTGAQSTEAAPGLMYGQAGIGYGLLRLTDLKQVPSVLLVEPPYSVGPGPNPDQAIRLGVRPLGPRSRYARDGQRGRAELRGGVA
jgi:type 2 lantibiotic biosynthesis protein LanM